MPLADKQNKPNKTQSKLVWWRLIIAIVLLVVAIGAGIMYFANPANMAVGIVLVFGLAGSGAFFYWGLNREPATSGFVFNKQVTGQENAIILFAKRNGNGKDTPVLLKIVTIEHPPTGARLHYVRNLKRHMYELFNDTSVPLVKDRQGSKRLKPVTLPDKSPFPPEKFTIPATMQVYKEAIEYMPPSMMQKIGPIALVIAMVVVGILIIVTTTGTGVGGA